MINNNPKLILSEIYIRGGDTEILNHDLQNYARKSVKSIHLPPVGYQNQKIKRLLKVAGVND